jgi:hypothetical protein
VNLLALKDIDELELFSESDKELVFLALESFVLLNKLVQIFSDAVVFLGVV